MKKVTTCPSHCNMSLLLFWVWVKATPGMAQSLLLDLCSGIIPGGALGTTCRAGDGIHVVHVQVLCLLYYLSDMGLLLLDIYNWLIDSGLKKCKAYMFALHVAHPGLISSTTFSPQTPLGLCSPKHRPEITQNSPSIQFWPPHSLFDRAERNACVWEATDLKTDNMKKTKGVMVSGFRTWQTLGEGQLPTTTEQCFMMSLMTS